jgi:hypothetical protein
LLGAVAGQLEEVERVDCLQDFLALLLDQQSLLLLAEADQLQLAEVTLFLVL